MYNTHPSTTSTYISIRLLCILIIHYIDYKLTRFNIISSGGFRVNRDFSDRPNMTVFKRITLAISEGVLERIVITATKDYVLNPRLKPLW